MQNNLGLFIAKRASISGNMEALVDVSSGRRLNYLELNARCNRLANGLLGGGLASGDRIATLLMNGPECIETFFGAAKVGGVLVALNWRLVADELSFILTDSGADTLVFGSAFNDVVGDLQARGAKGTNVRTWIHVGEAADRPDFAVGYEDLLERAGDAEPETDATLPLGACLGSSVKPAKNPFLLILGETNTGVGDSYRNPLFIFEAVSHESTQVEISRNYFKSELG